MKGRRSIFILLATLAACARTSGTVEIPPAELPFPLAREQTQIETPVPALTVTAYLVRGDRLVQIRREVEADTPPLEATLRVLLGGPTNRERSRGISTELPAAVRLLTLTVDSGTALVDLSGEFQEPADPGRIALRVAQVVWTLTEVSEVGSVRFAIDGELVAVTTPDGTAVDRPVTRADYAALSPTG